MLLRKARAMQLNLIELYEGVNPSTRNIVRTLSFNLETPETEMGVQVRSFLSVNLDQQLTWKNAEEGFKFWRDILEAHGVFVFKDAFQVESFSGFCLYDKQFPVIYVNNSKPATRQIFTLFRELAHLLFKTGGIDIRLDDYIDYLDGDDRLIEVLCNGFAGEFLVPSEDFDNRIVGSSIDESSIQELADIYCVSREVILRKCFDRQLIDQTYYNNRVNAWAQQGDGEKGSGGNYYFNQRVYLGTNYIEKAFARYNQNQISVERLADYLGVKVKNIDGMESLLYRKESAV